MSLLYRQFSINLLDPDKFNRKEVINVKNWRRDEFKDLVSIKLIFVRILTR
jgi:hypothetical protein